MQESKKVMSRRKFTRLSSAAIVSLPLMGFKGDFLQNNHRDLKELEVNLFSKHLQFLDYNEMAAAAANMGFNGIDLTVRPKGHVLPERVVDDLPKAVKAMNTYGLKPNMMTTNVWDTTDLKNKTVLETASKLGFEYYRTAWLSYTETKSIKDNQALYAKQAKHLEKLNKNLNLIGCYQNHAGNHVGAPIWDLPLILADSNNVNIGCQYDIRHAMVEGGQSWELGLQVIRPYIKTLVIKDFIWKKQNEVWKPFNVPLGQGMVDFKKYFSILKKYKINVPISLHLEYDLGGAEHGNREISMDKNQVFDFMKADLSYLRQTWQQAD